MEAFHLQRTRFELIVERKLRRRQLTEDGNVEITGRDLREKNPPAEQGSLFGLFRAPPSALDRVAAQHLRAVAVAPVIG